MGLHQRKDDGSKANYKRNAGIVKVFGACIFIALIFCAGFFVRGNTQLLGSLGFATLIPGDLVNDPALASMQDTVSSRVDEITALIDKESVNTYDLNEATTTMANALVAATNDAYVRYFDEASYQSYLQSASNPDRGIGVLFGEYDGRCYAVDVFEGSYAEAAGVQAGDFIQTIDGEQRDQWSMPDVMEALARPEGESTYITWRRPENIDASGGEVFSTTLPYYSEAQENITHETIEGIEYIDIRQLSSDSASVVRSIVTQAVQNGVAGVVIDLRDVPGGYLTQAVEIASMFITSGTVVQIQTNEAVTTRSADSETLTDLPVVVLANGRTSGSAEVLVAALQETQRATVVGTTTQGKGSVQVIQPLSFGGALRYTAAYYLTPSGNPIEGVGVNPDITVSNEGNQQTVAVEVARSAANG